MTKENTDNSDRPEMSIKPGDIVEWTKEKGYNWMTVEEIEEDQAICTYRTLDRPLDGEKRPTALVPNQAYFPLCELKVIRGH
jgi:hypothetical protein